MGGDVITKPAKLAKSAKSAKPTKNSSTLTKPTEPLATATNARTGFVFLALTGTLVTVRLSSGVRVEGIFHAFDQKERQISIRLAHVVDSEKSVDHEMFKFFLSELCSLVAETVNFSEVTGSTVFATDSEISGGVARQRELSRWEGGDETELDGLEDGPPGSWNQFELNERLFGVVTSFDEHEYTTVIDRESAEYGRMEREATRLAKEIERGGTTNVHVMEERGRIFDDSQIDEEDRYGAVVRAPETQITETKKSLHNGQDARPTQRSPVSYKQAAMANEIPSSKSPKKPTTAPLEGKLPIVSMPSSTSSTNKTSPTSEVSDRKPRRSIANLQATPESLNQAMEVVQTTTENLQRRMSQVAESDPQFGAVIQEACRREMFEKHKKDKAIEYKAFSDKISNKLSPTESMSPHSISSAGKQLNPNASAFVPTVAAVPCNLDCISHSVVVPYGQPFIPQHYAPPPMYPPHGGGYYNPYSMPPPPQYMMGDPAYGYPVPPHGQPYGHYPPPTHHDTPPMSRPHPNE